MRSRLLLASATLLAGLSFTASTAFAATAEPVAPAAGADVSASQCWLTAFNANDADAVAQCYATDAVLWLPGGPVTKGRDAIRAGYVGFLADMTVKSAVLTPMGSATVGDQSVNWGTYTIVMTSKTTGEETTEIGRYTDVSKKIDGRWQYVVDHASDDPKTAAPAEPSANG